MNILTQIGTRELVVRLIPTSNICLKQFMQTQQYTAYQQKWSFSHLHMYMYVMQMHVFKSAYAVSLYPCISNKKHASVEFPQLLHFCCCHNNYYIIFIKLLCSIVQTMKNVTCRKLVIDRSKSDKVGTLKDITLFANVHFPTDGLHKGGIILRPLSGIGTSTKNDEGTSIQYRKKITANSRCNWC